MFSAFTDNGDGFVSLTVSDNTVPQIKAISSVAFGALVPNAGKYQQKAKGVEQTTVAQAQTTQVGTPAPTKTQVDPAMLAAVDGLHNNGTAHTTGETTYNRGAAPAPTAGVGKIV